MDIKKPVSGLSVSRKEFLPSPHSNIQPWAVYHRNKLGPVSKFGPLFCGEAMSRHRSCDICCDEFTTEQEFSEAKGMRAKVPSRRRKKGGSG